MSKSTTYKYSLIALKSLLGFFVLLIIIDTNLSLAGRNTIIIRYIGGLGLIFYFLIHLFFIMYLINLLVSRKLKKVLILILLFLPYCAVTEVGKKVLVAKSKEEANQTVNDFFMGHVTPINVEVEKEVEETFTNFLSAYNKSSLSDVVAIPMYRRYDYSITPKTKKPFNLTLWVKDQGFDIWVHKHYEMN